MIPPVGDPLKVERKQGSYIIPPSEVDLGPEFKPVPRNPELDPLPGSCREFLIYLGTRFWVTNTKLDKVEWFAGIMIPNNYDLVSSYAEISYEHFILCSYYNVDGDIIVEKKQLSNVKFGGDKPYQSSLQPNNWNQLYNALSGLGVAINSSDGAVLIGPGGSLDPNGTPVNPEEAFGYAMQDFNHEYGTGIQTPEIVVNTGDIQELESESNTNPIVTAITQVQLDLFISVRADGMILPADTIANWQFESKPGQISVYHTEFLTRSDAILVLNQLYEDGMFVGEIPNYQALLYFVSISPADGWMIYVSTEFGMSGQTPTDPYGN